MITEVELEIELSNRLAEPEHRLTPEQVESVADDVMDLLRCEGLLPGMVGEVG